MIKKYILAPYVRVNYSKQVFFLGSASIKKEIVDQSLILAIIPFLKFLKFPRTQAEIKSYWNEVAVDLNREIGDSFFQSFLDGNYIIGEKDFLREERYSRHGLYYNFSGINADEVQERLKNKTVLILGCGGIGNLVSGMLVASGVGNIILMDDDIIEQSNLTRQILFTEFDEGRSKVHILKSALKSRNSSINISCIEHRITSPEDLNQIPVKIDLIVLSADKPASLIFWLNDYAVKNKLPFINIGYVEDIAVWGPFVIPGETGCFRCQPLVGDDSLRHVVSIDDINAINADYQAPSYAPINMMASSFAVLDIMRFLGEFGEIQSLNKRIGLWTHNLRMETQSCHKNESCLICSK